LAKIEVECCEGREGYGGHCIKSRCPIYRGVQENVDGAWPYTETGFGNLYGNPTHEIYLAEVRDGVKENAKRKKKTEKEAD
jgi:hypothetical protein